MTSTPIVVPDIDPEADVLTAALAYAAAGLFVGPLKAGTKHPGSRLGTGWHRLTSTDPEVLAAWFAGTSDGLFLHAGRSGLVVLDVDEPDALHPLVRAALDEHAPPYQTTRDGQDGRGHFLFAMPPGRVLGNGLGSLTGGWGEIRGRNGVIVVAPSVHADAAAGGCYRWRRAGAVPVLPDALAKALDDAHAGPEDTATVAEVAAFLESHTGAERPELLDVHARAWQARVQAGESRHQYMCGHLAGALKEARAGLLDARTAADTLESLFLAEVQKPPRSRNRVPPAVLLLPAPSGPGYSRGRLPWR